MNITPQARGTELLLQHCLTIGGVAAEPRQPVKARLEQAVGDELARLLVLALAPQGLRGSSSP